MGNLERAKNITTMEKLVQGTVQNSTSGTSIDFTGIPSWAKKITVMFNGVSTNGASNFLVRLGSSAGIETSGYTGLVVYINPSNNLEVLSSGFTLANQQPTTFFSGLMTLVNININTWVENGSIGSTTFSMSTGSKTLSGTLDRIRITTVNGTDTFDAGQINIMYEG